MPDDKERAQDLDERITAEIADIQDPVAARAIAKALTNLKKEYTALAERNRGIILKFSRQARVLLAVLFLAILPLAVVSVKLSSENGQHIQTEHNIRRASIRLSCEESNKRHGEAIPQVAALVSGTPPKDEAERRTRAEVLAALAPEGPRPRTSAGRTELKQLRAFVQIIAPAYNCADRVAKFSR